MSLINQCFLLSSDGDGRNVVSGVNENESIALGITDTFDDFKLARNIVFSLLLVGEEKERIRFGISTILHRYLPSMRNTDNMMTISE